MNEQIVWMSGFGIHITPWKLIGLTGALMFGGRWLIQFIASRRHGKPVIPRAFWYMSIVGSLMTLSYFIFSAKQDAVGVLQNLFPSFTAAYSLYQNARGMTGLPWRREAMNWISQRPPNINAPVRPISFQGVMWMPKPLIHTICSFMGALPRAPRGACCA